MTREIVLTGGMRTPFGDVGKSLNDTPLAALGIHAARPCLERADLDAEHVEHLVWGNVLPVDQEGYLAARAPKRSAWSRKPASSTGASSASRPASWAAGQCRQSAHCSRSTI